MLRADLHQLKAKLSWHQRLIRWVLNDSLGTLDMLRMELERNYSAQRIFIPSYDGTVLDCMFVLGRGTEGNVVASEPTSRTVDNDLDASIDTRNAFDVGPTVFLCNGNGAIYEFSCMDNDWLNFYVESGVNVLLWNYRGYGRSQSFPTPYRLRRDAEAVVDYLRSTMGVRKLGVHGLSMGGMVASHVAKRREVDFLCADRSFSSLGEVVRYGFNRVFELLYLAFTLWTRRVGGDYIEAKCPKILMIDLHDEIIPTPSSLAFGVSRELLRRKYLGEGMHGGPQSERFLLARYPGLGNVASMLPFTRRRLIGYLRRWQAEASLADHHLNVLASSDYKVLYYALKRIFSIIIDSSRARKGRSGEAHEMHRIETAAFDHDGRSGMPEEERKEENDEEVNETLRDIKLLDDEEEGYRVSLENEEVSEDLQTFFLKVYSLLQLIDAAGCTLDDIFGSHSRSQSELFKMFLVNLEIWGSSLPLKLRMNQEFERGDFNHKLALHKLETFIRKTEAFIALERKNNPSALNRKVLDDLEIVAKKFRTVSDRVDNNLGIRHEKKRLRQFNSHNDSGENSMNESKILIDTTSFMSSYELSSLTLEDIKRHIGYLLPVSCGHNGNLTRLEAHFFEKFLKSISFLK
eukprot:TRINITY_DN1793_c0_g1_i1.p1 TRINITY_DN1793_c0_g1~~TRINITY_DN1793_c0_g1_i1.p1  ORF type:complete len:632 (-),score=173.61 TRINITY_DN1793_c0_g1_i1:116-2011(-)